MICLFLIILSEGYLNLNFITNGFLKLSYLPSCVQAQESLNFPVLISTAQYTLNENRPNFLTSSIVLNTSKKIETMFRSSKDKIPEILTPRVYENV